MTQAWTYIVSITALAAVLAIIANGITIQWEQDRAMQLIKAANLPARGAVPALCRELLTRNGVAAYRQAAWAGCVKS